MNRKGGTATVAVLLAILGVTYLPRPGGESTPATEAKKAAATKRNAEQSQSIQAKDAVGECREISDHIKRFYGKGTYYPSSCFPHTTNRTQPVPPAHPDLHFVIAIVPNPVQTHLSLYFDRSVEAIQQAAQDDGYTYDGSWFPWDDNPKDSDSLDDKEIAKSLEEQEHRQPGILVFRRGLGPDEQKPYSGGSVVFLVGEQPTGGIDDVQFEHALEWTNLLQPIGTEGMLSILGPTFSGSLTSLARELELEVLPGRYAAVHIYSGSVSADQSISEFKKFLKEKMGTSGAVPEFQTYSEGDAVMTNRFLCYLRYHHYSLDSVAILSEDQTTFGRQSESRSKTDGQSADPASKANASADNQPGDGILRCGGNAVGENERPIYLYYPRDIASLRSAYEKQSIFSAGKQASTNAPSATLRSDLSESDSREHDAVRSYAGQLTPLAQEAALFGITNVLDNKHIEFVILRSTNPLDQLFLSEFLRRSYPSGRVVIDGSDLLFRRGMQGASLRGVMLLSTYPLLSWTQDAIPSFRAARHGGYRVFAQDGSESLYIAARELFSQFVGKSVESVPISDYAPPPVEKIVSADDVNRPATWISVVGHRQFWPLAVLNSNTEREAPAEPSLLKPEDPKNKFLPVQRKVQFPGEMVGLLAFCLMLGFWHVYCCWKGSIIGSPRVRAYFAPIPRLQHLILIFLGSLVIGYLGILLALSLKSGLPALAPRSAVSLFLTVATMVVTGFLGCLTNYRLPVLSPDVTKDGSIQVVRWRRWALLVWPMLLIALAYLHNRFLISRLDASNLYPTFWRSVFLRSGVSGLLPQVLLLLGLYAWFWCNLQGLSLFGADRPVLPRKNDLPEFDVPPKPRPGEQVQDGHKIKAFRMFSREDAADHIEAAALPLTFSYLKSLAVFLPVTIVASYFALGEFGLRTLGDRRFGSLILLGACLCIAMILADALQFLRTWSRLRQLLIFLDRLRLRRTLAALKGLSWESVWKMSGNVLEQRYRLISRQFESMRNLQNTLDAWHPTDPKETQARDATLAQLEDCGRKGAWFAEWYVNLCDPGHLPPTTDLTPLQEFQEALASTAACVMTQIIYPAWNKETQSLILKADRAGKASQDEDDKEHQADQPTAAVESPVQAAEEFFVLPYLGFIQNTIGRIRSLAMSMLVLFVAATLAVSSYPFDPLPVIGAIFLITFALVGVTVIFVYAEMHRDATLSHITNKNPGELGFDFWAKLFAFGAGPLIGLLTTLFPSITDFVVSWLQPGAQAIK